VPLFTSGGLGLGLVSSGLDLGLSVVMLVLVLRIWFCLHHWRTCLLASWLVTINFVAYTASSHVDRAS